MMKETVYVLFFLMGSPYIPVIVPSLGSTFIVGYKYLCWSWFWHFSHYWPFLFYYSLFSSCVLWKLHLSWKVGLPFRILAIGWVFICIWLEKSGLTISWHLESVLCISVLLISFMVVNEMVFVLLYTLKYWSIFHCR